MRLDDFECLVGKRCRIYGDLGSHVPCGMLQGISGRDCFEGIRTAFPKRAAGRGEDESRDFALTCATQALQHSAVLTVDGNECAAAARECMQHEWPARNE